MTSSTATIDHLRPGHEYPGESINSRTAYRDADIKQLAASLKDEGQLKPLLTCTHPSQPGIAFVFDGNRRLAAFALLDASTPIEIKSFGIVSPTDALRKSMVANESVPLHPVDRFEVFAKVQTEGATVADIAARFLMTEKAVRQSLALGNLHPSIRDAWRAGNLTAECAQAFTLEADQKRQEQIYKKLAKQGNKSQYAIREAIVGSRTDAGLSFVKFVGIETYEAAGGNVKRDLFGGRHGVSDPALAKKLADQKLVAECERLIADGWSWAETDETLPRDRWQWKTLESKPVYEPAETARNKEIEARLKQIQQIDDEEMDDDLYRETEELENEREAIINNAKGRGFTAKQKAQSGCEVGIGQDGELEIRYGRVKTQAEQRKATAAMPGAAAAKDGPKPPAKLSNSLKDRLRAHLDQATQDALKVSADGPGLVHALAGIVASQIKADRPNHMHNSVLNAMDVIRKRLPAKDFNAALAKRFDHKGYFSSAPHKFVLKAIAEAMGADHAAKFKDKKKSDTWKFASANVPKTGWLPPEVRTLHYAGPVAKTATVTKLKPKADAKKAPKAKRKAA